MGAADAAHGAGRAVLLVVGVQDEEHVEGALERPVRRVLHLGHLEQHVQEVAGEAEVVVGVDVGAAHAVAVGEGGDRRHLGNQPHHLLAPRLGVEDVLAVGIEGRHRTDGAHEHAHRMGVVGEALHELLDVLVHHGVHGDLVGPRLQLVGGRQLAEQDQIGGLEERALVGELLDRVAAIHQHALVAVDVGDLAAARRGVHERRVVGSEAEVVVARLDLAQIHRLDGAVGDRDVVLLAGAVVGDGEGIGHDCGARGPGLGARGGWRKSVVVVFVVTRLDRRPRDSVRALGPPGEVFQLAAPAAEGSPLRLHRTEPAHGAHCRLLHPTHSTSAVGRDAHGLTVSHACRAWLQCARRDVDQAGSADAWPWCRTSRADTMKITSSATLVA